MFIFHYKLLVISGVFEWCGAAWNSKIFVIGIDRRRCKFLNECDRKSKRIVHEVHTNLFIVSKSTRDIRSIIKRNSIKNRLDVLSWPVSARNIAVICFGALLVAPGCFSVKCVRTPSVWFIIQYQFFPPLHFDNQTSINSTFAPTHTRCMYMYVAIKAKSPAIGHSTLMLWYVVIVSFALTSFAAFCLLRRQRRQLHQYLKGLIYVPIVQQQRLSFRMSL